MTDRFKQFMSGLSRLQPDLYKQLQVGEDLEFTPAEKAHIMESVYCHIHKEKDDD